MEDIGLFFTNLKVVRLTIENVKYIDLSRYVPTVMICTYCN